MHHGSLRDGNVCQVLILVPIGGFELYPSGSTGSKNPIGLSVPTLSNVFYGLFTRWIHKKKKFIGFRKCSTWRFRLQTYFLIEEFHLEDSRDTSGEEKLSSSRQKRWGRLQLKVEAICCDLLFQKTERERDRSSYNNHISTDRKSW